MPKRCIYPSARLVSMNTPVSLDLVAVGFHVLLWTIVLLQGLLAVDLLRRLGQLHKLIERGGVPGERTLSVGSRAPALHAIDLRSGAVSEAHPLHGNAGLLLFVSTDCASCRNLVARLTSSVDLMPIAVVCQGSDSECRAMGGSLVGTAKFLHAHTADAFPRFGVSRLPTAVALDSEHVIRGYAYPQSVEDLHRLYTNSLLAGATPGSELSTHQVSA
jgi:hypothetical protein